MTAASSPSTKTGPGQEQPAGQPFQLGVNYWPRRKAMFWWSRFDAGEVKDEFDQIRALGLTLVRIFLLWEDFQPTPETVSRTAIENLRRVCDIAVEAGLQLDVTFFVGHMSGPSWVPSWMLLPEAEPPSGVRQVVSGGRARLAGYRNMFTDGTVQAASKTIVGAVMEALAGHPAVRIWNLGNEPDLFARPKNAEAGREWIRRAVGWIKERDPDTTVTCGLHVHSLIENNGLRVDHIFSETDLAVMHGYPMYMDWARGPLDPDFVPFLCALTSALCGRPTLMEEFGGPTMPPGEDSATWRWKAYGARRSQFMASEEALAGYLEAVLPKLVAVGALGALIWCFADYDPALYDRPPCDQARHERHFGLVRPDGSLKPHARVLKKFADRNPRVGPSSRAVQMDLPADEFYKNPARHAARLYQAYLNA